MGDLTPLDNRRAIFYAVHPKGNPEDILQILNQFPQLKLTLLFPPRYFESEERLKSLDGFRLLQSSKQIDIALTLDNQPPLPLLAGLPPSFGVSFSWPEDVAGHLARGSGRYNQRWGQLPSGFYPPFLGVSVPVLDTLKRFRFDWVLLPPQEISGVRVFSSTVLIVPPRMQANANAEEGSREWAEALARFALTQPFSFIDFSLSGDSRWEALFLKQLTLLSTWPGTSYQLVTGKEFSEQVDDSDILIDDVLFDPEYALAWVQTNQQRYAWGILAAARKTIATYQNSGHANLKKLDAALEEMYTAESGEFLLVLGIEDAILDEQKRVFLATIANIYRLCGAEIPANVKRWSIIKSEKQFTSKSSVSSQPFFIEGPQQLIWNDPLSDDFGGGTLRSPLGAYAQGVFDLQTFSVSWTETDVTFAVSMAALASAKSTIVLPTVDVYVDINRLSGAGSTSGLPSRWTTGLQSKAAWEYAVSFNTETGALSQSVAGKSPRVVSTLRTWTDVDSKTFGVTLPRSLLRGQPDRWRFSIGVMGSEARRAGQEILPVPVHRDPDERAFGGAVVGRQASPYIDILAETIEDQQEALSVYEQGVRVVLPFVEVDQ